MNDHDKLRAVERNEDMSQAGKMKLIRQPDGDVVVALHGPDGGYEVVEFCASGGRSPNTLAALRILFDAMEADNQGAALAALGGKGEAVDPTGKIAVLLAEKGADESATQPEAQGEAEDFHDILYGAKLKILLDPENDSSAVSGCVGATFGPNDDLEIMLHAVDADGGVVKLHTAASKPVEGVTEPWYGHRFCEGRDGRWRCADGCGPVLVEEAQQQGEG